MKLEKHKLKKRKKEEEEANLSESSKPELNSQTRIPLKPRPELN
jgi:hypothetical protein